MKISPLGNILMNEWNKQPQINEPRIDLTNGQQFCLPNIVLNDISLVTNDNNNNKKHTQGGLAGETGTPPRGRGRLPPGRSLSTQFRRWAISILFCLRKIKIKKSKNQKSKRLREIGADTGDGNGTDGSGMEIS